MGRTNRRRRFAAVASKPELVHDGGSLELAAAIDVQERSRSVQSAVKANRCVGRQRHRLCVGAWLENQHARIGAGGGGSQIETTAPAEGNRAEATCIAAGVIDRHATPLDACTVRD